MSRSPIYEVLDSPAAGTARMAQSVDLGAELIRLAKLASKGDRDDSVLFIRSLVRRLRSDYPQLAAELGKLMKSPARAAVLRKSVAQVPVDTDSRLQLARVDDPVILPVDPIWSEQVRQCLEQVVAERQRLDDLASANLAPTRSLLFTGPPGVGKTLTAKWIAASLSLPLITLDLSAVMSSYLGRTGSNVRNVMDYARGTPCVLLVDEFDAIAKRRSDHGEVGELKRLVTVLLQEIESWPQDGFLIAATNHSELLDPAVWRRFDVTIEFQLPDVTQLTAAVSLFLDGEEVSSSIRTAVVEALTGQSYSDVERSISKARREAVIGDESLEERLVALVRAFVGTAPKVRQKQIAVLLVQSGLSQREANVVTGVARNTIAAALRE